MPFFRPSPFYPLASIGQGRIGFYAFIYVPSIDDSE